ncbi:MAG: (4Fe-4S)-binding protein [Candidatus Muiribacterium halophilum]|uniref:(4Fe-4S)-binding protein n=1 Tax=Muiribacterium halophilum TaxID=2053465 RepID=A0A2N5ZAA4_MUIH1|nr:MAG: (4Fe-4S)-binding protein [Candidatus Muirbacterium halophilum]
MKELVIISGKGGTGKTSLTAAFIKLMGRCVAADCDVDAADLDLLLGSKNKSMSEFTGRKRPVIDEKKCTSCGKCYEVCEFDAIIKGEISYNVDNYSCEGCGACYYFCPENAITFEPAKSGEVYISDTKNGPFVHARLIPGEENSGKLVIAVKNEAKRLAIDNNIENIIIDGSPGTGCPVIATISGSDYVVVVTEPTFSGMHDLERVLALTDRFSIKAGVIVNKSDINVRISKEIQEKVKASGKVILGEIPYDREFIDALQDGKSIVEFNKDSKLSQMVQNIYNKIIRNLEEV